MMYAIWLYIKSIPGTIYVIILALVVISLYGHYREQLGRRVVHAQWDAATIKRESDAAKATVKKQEVVEKIVTVFVKKAAKDKIITRTLIKEVDRYVSRTDPMLSGGFRLLHDAAASGKEISDTTGIDDEAVAAATVAETIAENYTECRYDKDRLGALQEIVRTLND